MRGSHQEWGSKGLEWLYGEDSITVIDQIDVRPRTDNCTRVLLLYLPKSKIFIVLAIHDGTACRASRQRARQEHIDSGSTRAFTVALVISILTHKIAHLDPANASEQPGR
jgi:hypothetical protein